MKKLVFGLFLVLGILGFSNCIPRNEWYNNFNRVIVYKQGVPAQYHYGYIPRALTRVERDYTGRVNSVLFVTFVPIRELRNYRNNPEQLPYFTLKFTQCNY